MNEIVKYHNDMNAVSFTGFNAVELDLLLSICAKIRDERTLAVTYSFEQLKELSKYSQTATKTFVRDLRNTYKKLIRLTFCLGDDAYFTEFVLFTKYTVDINNQQVTIGVNHEFSYLLNELTSNFTRFELAEFVGLASKYSKNLYRLLKQFRTTGQVFFTVADFRIKLDIPKSYEMRDINKTILEPIQRELTPLFENFRIEKVKNTKKRGHPVTHINFYFEPQQVIQNASIAELEQVRKIYLPDFTLDEMKIFSRHGKLEHLKQASKQYDNIKKGVKIDNKVGYMIKLIKNIANPEPLSLKSGRNYDNDFLNTLFE